MDQHNKELAEAIFLGVKEALTSILRSLRDLLIITLVGGFIILIISNFFKIGYDSTDSDKRSGMGLHIDNKTGCHYLSNPRGGITPRLDKDNNHLCIGADSNGT